MVDSYTRLKGSERERDEGNNSSNRRRHGLIRCSDINTKGYHHHTMLQTRSQATEQQIMPIKHTFFASSLISTIYAATAVSFLSFFQN